MSENAGTPHAFELKGTAATLTVLRLRCTDIERIERELQPRVAQLPHFFQHAPVVVDVGALDEGEDVPFAKLLDVLRACKLVPVAVRNAEGARLEAALDAGLGQLKGGARALRDVPSPQRAPAPEPTPEASEEPDISPGEARTIAEPSPIAAEARTIAEPSVAAETIPEPDPAEPPAPSLTIKTPVRGGQVVYAQGTDLVLLAPVNPGGEVIADGNIHAYAPIRGRALAGAHGNEDARIFCKSLDADLVSVAGQYLSAEEIKEQWRGKAVQVRLDGGKLVISEL